MSMRRAGAMGVTEAMTASPSRLRAGEAQLSCLRIEDDVEPRVLERLGALLSEEEHGRLGAFRFERDRRQFLLAHALVRSTLSRHTGRDPRAWRFVSNRWGRPEIDRPRAFRGLRFNLSHTRGLVAVLVAWEHEVGVDVEETTRPHAGLEIADRYFSAQEAAALRALPPAEQGERFLEYWTLKEAYIKARGMGLSLPLDRFSFAPRPSPPTITFAAPSDDDPEAWQFGQLRPSASHLLAWAIRRQRRRDLEVRVVHHRAQSLDPTS